MMIKMVRINFKADELDGYLKTLDNVLRNHHALKAMQDTSRVDLAKLRNKLEGAKSRSRSALKSKVNE